MEKIKLKMKNGYLLIKELTNETVTDAGIIIPDTSNNRKAFVLSTSKDSDISKGDIIIRSLGKGTPMTINGHKLEMIHENHVMAVIKNNDNE